MGKASQEIMLLRLFMEDQAAIGVNSVLYQSGGHQTGLIVNMDVYKPDKTKDAAQSGIASEIENTGSYYLSFTSDGPGWFVLIRDNAGGQGVKQF